MLMLYLLGSFFILIISFCLFQRAAGTLSFFKPNLISYVFYLNIVLQTFIAAVLAVLYLDNHYVISHVGMDVRHYVWLAVMYLMIALPIGMLMAKFIFARGIRMQSLLNSYVNAPIQVSGLSGNSLKYVIWIFTVVSMLACLYTFWEVGYFPFVKVLNSNPAELAVTRISVSRDFSGNAYVRNIFALGMMPILSYIWMFYYLASKKTLDLLMVTLGLIFSLSILYYDFSKAPMLWYVLGFVFVRYYALGKFKLYYVCLLTLVVFVALVFMYAMSGIPFNEFASYNTGPLGRIILGQAAGIYIIFDIFPNNHGFIGLSSLSQFVSNLIGYEYTERAARVAMEFFNPRGIEGGTAGVMNTIFIAEAWANFGLVGLLLSPIWVGFLLQSLYIFFLKMPKNPLFLAFFVSFSFGGAVTGGFNDYIYNANVIMKIVIFIIIMGCALYLRTFFSKRIIVKG